MAIYNPEELNTNGDARSTDISLDSTSSFTLTTTSSNGYFIMEIDAENGIYNEDSNIISGSFDNLVGLTTSSIIQHSPYIVGFALSNETSSFDFYSNSEITGSNLKLRAAGSIYLELTGSSGGGGGGCTPQGLVWTSTLGTANIFYQPAYGLYDYSVVMHIFLAAEVAAGINCINGLEFEVNGYTTPYTYNNFTIKLAHVQNSFFGTAVTVGLDNLTVSDVTIVKENFNLTIANSGWQTVNFDTKFEWNGTDNILIIYENRDGSYASGYGWGEVLNQGAGINRTAYKYQDTSYPSNSTILTVDNRRLNTRLKY